MIPFTKEDRKAFYDVVEPYQFSNFVNKLGYCFKMNYQPDDQFPRQLMWVTSSKLLIQQDQTQKKRFIAERCIQRKGKKVISELDVAELHTTDSGIAFINCDDKEKNFLNFGDYHRGLPEEAFAYVFDGKDMLGLKFVKTGDGADATYTLESSSAGDKVKHFEIRKAVGAPIIVEVCPPERNQVVGILNIEANGTLKPVFFDLQTFEQNSPSELESNDDKTDGLTQASQESANGDKKDIPSAALKDSANNDKTDSPGLVDVLTETVKHCQIQLDEKKYNDQQPTQECTGGSTLRSAFECLKKKKLRNALNTYTLKQNLKICLDPEQPMGNDYRQLAESFGYDCRKIRYLGLSPTKKSPTVTLLEDKSGCTIEQLRGKLINMERDDAVEIIDEYIKNQGCNCENCGSLR